MLPEGEHAHRALGIRVHVVKFEELQPPVVVVVFVRPAGGDDERPTVPALLNDQLLDLVSLRVPLLNQTGQVDEENLIFDTRTRHLYDDRHF